MWVVYGFRKKECFGSEKKSNEEPLFATQIYLLLSELSTNLSPTGMIMALLKFLLGSKII